MSEPTCLDKGIANLTVTDHEEGKVSSEDKNVPGVKESPSKVGVGVADDGKDLPSKRVVKKTERMQEHLHNKEKKSCSRLVKRLLKQEKLITILMQSVDNKAQVLYDSNEYDKIFSELVASYSHLLELIDEPKELETAQTSLDELDTSVFAFKEKIYTWISEIIDKPSTTNSLPVISKEGLLAPNPGHDTNRKLKLSPVRKNVTSRSLPSNYRLPMPLLEHHPTTPKPEKLSHRSPIPYPEYTPSTSSNTVSSKHQKAASEHSSQSSSSSISKYSSKHPSNAPSIASSSSSKRSLDLRAEAAGLRAEASVLKRKRKMELEAELLEYDQKIKRAEAMEKVYIEEENRYGTEHLQFSYRKKAKIDETTEQDGKVKREKRQTEKRRRKHRERTDKVVSSRNLDQTLLDVLRLQSAPKVDIDIFSGDVLEYQYFVETFHEVVERVIPDERGRLTRLIQSTEGEPKELIRHCIHDERDVCYTNAMLLLQQQYGDPYRIASAYLKELHQWPKIKANDAKAFRSFNHFLIKCKIYKKKGHLRELDSAENLRALVVKFPINLQDKWNRRSDRVKITDSRMAEFGDFCDFVDTESRIVNDPIFSQEALKGCQDSSSSISTRCLATSMDEAKPKVEVDLCPMCSGEHDLEDCDKYKERTRSARMKFLFEKRLCFGCYDRVTSTHKAESCNQKRVCTVCQEQHPTGLHKHETPVLPSRSTISHSSNQRESEIVSMCIVPVRLSHKDHPDKEITVYAVLDDCSKGTFILESVLSDLDLTETRPTQVTIRTMTGCTTEDTFSVEGLVVKCSTNHETNYPSSKTVQLPKAFSRSMIPVENEEIPTIERVRRWDHLKPILQKLSSYDSSIPFGLLIGANCPKALEPHEVILSVQDGPYALRSQLGWCLVGTLGSEGGNTTNNQVTSRITTIDAATNNTSKHHFAIQKEVEDTSIKELLIRMYESEFTESHSEKQSLSQEDRKFISIMENNCQRIEGHYQLPLPFRNKNIKMPYNKNMAIQRALPLKRKFIKNPKFHADYAEFMNKLMEKGYAQRCETESKGHDWNGWIIPHHGVYHPQKPDQIRVVFDCASRLHGVSLNTELLQGPDLANSMIGVFLRFRKEEIPFMADIECMFYQVRIPPEQRKFVRFLWWPNGNIELELCEYEMCAHLFGAVSSPGVANFALKKCAEDCQGEFSENELLSVRNDFYVDDLLKSEPSEGVAIQTALAAEKICASGGFNLTKFITPSNKLLNHLPREKRVNFIDDIHISTGEKMKIPKALGVTWCVQNDTIKFRINLQDCPLTRQGMLSSISSIYDPDGTGSAFLLEGRKILQEVTSDKELGWYDKVPESFVTRWSKWREELLLLTDLEMPRCFKPVGFGTIVCTSLHTFSDASERGYGKCSYLRQVNKDGEIHVSLVMAKSRVAPLNKMITIPRLELSAAMLGAKIHAMLKEELRIEGLHGQFWVDSKIVLGYILNETKRFKTYVANRVQKITSLTAKEQWDYVDTKTNPADFSSRGLSPKEKDKMKVWFGGPEILWKKKEDWVKEEVITEYPPDDIEVKVDKEVIVNCTALPVLNIVETLELRVSRWSRMKRAMAWALRFISNCRKSTPTVTGTLEVQEVHVGEETLLRLMQEHYLKSDMSALKGKLNRVTKQSHLQRLDPFIDNTGVIRVGGRLRKGKLASEVKFPIIIPKQSKIAKLIVAWAHMMVEHTGRTTTLNEIRNRGFWVVNSCSLTRGVLFKCVLCRELRGRCGQQKMADLPEERISGEEAPFTYCGVDYFGPLYVKEGRKELKRYGSLFTCFSSRAIHIEVAKSLTTDSFINALRRFIGRRGPVRSIRSDNGTNFVGADNELTKALEEMDHIKIAEYLTTTESCDWIKWERNPPTASHMGGVWERQIRTVRAILQSQLKDKAHLLDDETLHTLLVEVEAIVNSRPLTVDNLNDPDSLPLAPSQLLTMKSRVVLPPPGVFLKEDLYTRKRWRRVQHLANEFWDRWRKEVLRSLQKRQKWNVVRRNFQVGDIVLIQDDDVVRNHWPRGVVVETFPDNNGLVRTVNLRMANSSTILKRPITKLVLLVESQDK